jgi:leucyl aminopeptidase
MLNCFASQKSRTCVPIMIVTKDLYKSWLVKQNAFIKNWLLSTQFKPESQAWTQVPSEKGELKAIIFCVKDETQFWSLGLLPFVLPSVTFYLEADFSIDPNFYLAWGLGAYQFKPYKSKTKNPAKLFIPSLKFKPKILSFVQSIYLVRDLINTPAEDMGPTQLAKAASVLAKTHKATFKQIIGKNLLKQNYPTIYTVGRASDDVPRLIDIHWGNPKHRKLTLVGKGVCFDTGGLDIKASSGMLLMKKDMGGAAHALGLANMIMAAKLPVCLRVLIPAVENSVAGNAYRPGDIIKTRKGLTVEIGNTDAEGRLVLADALTEAVMEKPDLLIDFATLTGAARVALGTDLPALFCNNDALAADLVNLGLQEQDPLWRLPLHAPYRESLNSSVADINNCSSDSYAGAITAALFIQEFVPDSIRWLHLDLMAWNTKTRPGKPLGGEAMALRTLFSYVQKNFKN